MTTLYKPLGEVGLTENGHPPEGRDWANRGVVCSTCDDGGCPDCTDPIN